MSHVEAPWFYSYYYVQALAISHNADRKAHEVMIALAKESVKSAEQAVLLVLNADDDDEALGEWRDT